MFLQHQKKYLLPNTNRPFLQGLLARSACAICGVEVCKKQREIYGLVHAVSEDIKPVWGLVGDAGDIFLEGVQAG